MDISRYVVDEVLYLEDAISIVEMSHEPQVVEAQKEA